MHNVALFAVNFRWETTRKPRLSANTADIKPTGDNGSAYGDFNRNVFTQYLLGADSGQSIQLARS